MFKTIKTGKPPFFVEQKGPWIQTFPVACAVAADINGDGLDE